MKRLQNTGKRCELIRGLQRPTTTLGVALYNKGLIDEAIAEYREALRINPGDAEAHYNLGYSLYNKGLIDEAIVAFENFIKYAPPQYASYVDKVKGIIRELKG